MSPLKAKAFFVDRVRDAVVAVGAEAEFKNIEPPSPYPTWIKFGADILEVKDEKLVERAYKRSITALQEYTT
jgi:hypothetical protein